MQIVRRKLTPDDVTAPGTRYDATCDCIQVTPDGGTTWVDTTGLDPRSNTAYQLPPLETADPKCDSAAGMVQLVRDAVEQLNRGGDAGAAASLLYALIGLFLPGLGLLIDLILIGIGALLEIGLVSINEAMTEDVYDQLLCIFLNLLESDGTFPESNFAQLYTDVEAQLDETAAGVCERLFDIVGFVGLSNAGAFYALTGDCAACGTWCYEMDFSLSDFDFLATETAPSGCAPWSPLLGEWVSGTGWESVDSHRSDCNDYVNALAIHLALPTSTYTLARLSANVTFGTSSPDIRGTSLTMHLTTVSSTDQGDINVEWSGIQAGTPVISLTIITAYLLGSPPSYGTGIVGLLHLEGTGANPFGEDNC